MTWEIIRGTEFYAKLEEFIETTQPIRGIIISNGKTWRYSCECNSRSEPPAKSNGERIKLGPRDGGGEWSDRTGLSQRSSLGSSSRDYPQRSLENALESRTLEGTRAHTLEARGLSVCVRPARAEFRQHRPTIRRFFYLCSRYLSSSLFFITFYLKRRWLGSCQLHSSTTTETLFGAQFSRTYAGKNRVKTTEHLGRYVQINISVDSTISFAS